MRTRLGKGSNAIPYSAKAAPLGESCGPVGLEILPAVEAAFRVEQVVDRSMGGGELLECSHPPEAKHRPFPSSEWLMGILRAVIHPPAGLLSVTDAERAQGGAIGAQTVGDEVIGRAMALQRFPEEFQCRLLVARLRHEAFRTSPS